MKAGERGDTENWFVPYKEVMESIATKLGISMTFYQWLIKDLLVPTERHMKRTLNHINLCIKYDKPVYVQCQDRIGRTGTLVGRYLIRHGMADSKNVLEMIKNLRKNCEDSDRQSLETSEQREMVLGWPRGTLQAP